MRKVVVLDNQSLFDIAIQHCGSVDAAYDIAVLNNISITAALAAGQTLTIPEPFNKDIVNYYKSKGIAPATYSSGIISISPVKFGRLYNWYSVNDARGLAPEGWHIPTDGETDILINYLGGSIVAGGKMKMVSNIYWNSPNVGATNECGFNGKGGGQRQQNGAFSNILSFGIFWNSNSETDGESWFYDVNAADAFASFGNSTPNKVGLSVRCLKDDSVNPGIVFDAIGNCYQTVKIGDQVWMAENLITTKYRNGEDIPEVTDDAAWAALSTGAWCAYNNDHNNI